MADENSIGGKVGLDITDFKANISQLNREIKVIESGFKATAAGLGDWGASAEGLQAKIESLTSVTEAQAKKVENLKEIYKKVAEEKGADSKAAQELEIKINQETAALNKNKLELANVTDKLDNFGKETDDAKVKTEDLEDKTNKLANSFKNIGGNIAKATVVGIAAIGTAAVGAAAGIFKMATNAAESAGKIQELADKSGIGAEELQKWQYIGQNVGVELETITGAQTKLIKSMAGAKDGAKGQTEAFEKLGISVTDSSGSLKDSEAVFGQAVDALGKVKNETERNALAMEIFGKSAMELNPIIKAGSSELKKLGTEAEKFGIILSAEQIANLDAFGDSIDNLKSVFQGVGANIATVALPAMNLFIGNLQNIGVAIGQAVKTGDWTQVGTAISEGLNSIVGMITEGAPAIINIATTILTGIVNALLQAIPTILPLLINAVVLLLNSLIKILQDNGPLLIQAGINALTTLIDGIVDALPKLIPMAVELILKLVDAIVEALPKLIPAAIDMVVALVDGIIEALPKLIEAMPKLIKAVVTGIVDNLPKLIDAAIKIVVKLTQAIIENLPLIIEATIQIVGAIAGALIENIPTILATVPKIFKGIVDAFTGLDWKSIGTNLIEGIKNGVVDAAKGLASSVANAAKSALSAAKSVLGIKSPSRVFKEQVGEMIGAGMAEGVTDSTNLVNKAMGGLSKQLVANGEFNINSNLKGGKIGSGGLTIQVINQGTLVGSNGMNEFADTISQKISGKLGLSLGGAY